MGSAFAHDLALVRRLQRGDEAAFESFFNDYFPRLFRFAWVRAGRHDDLAEDAVQAALSRAISKFDSYRAEASLFSWLCTFVRHELFRQARGATRAQQMTELIEDHPEAQAMLASLASGALPTDRLLRDELIRRVHAVLDCLPQHYALCLEWKYSEGTTVEQIASRLGVGIKAAESLLTRARQAFREGYQGLVAAESWPESARQ